jgi:hypothetical protein
MLAMDVDDVIKAVVDMNFGKEDLDKACLLRLEKIAMDNGKDGRVALKLLPVLRDLLNI